MREFDANRQLFAVKTSRDDPLIVHVKLDFEISAQTAMAAHDPVRKFVKPRLNDYRRQ